MYPSAEIRIAMARQNLNDNDVSERSGVHRATVSAIRQGTAENPKLKTLEDVARATGLGMKVEFFEIETEAAIAK